ncbi:hypothetical protein [Acetobacterium wieringae]|uniref:Uncharacterized protein n=1 Tax=Acetobacterium wieringae TaxID=52694 RepID=A0A1F2PDA9_9FIRM|nr:hypothetical protein [Acetobacterium wieringae]OFV69248.1 hypothetical protein ACWI_32920 [Acetobacterium wieringae]
MKYLNTMQNKDGKEVDVDGHQHTKSEITDMPTKLSEFLNDIGAGGGVSALVIINQNRKNRMGGM